MESLRLKLRIVFYKEADLWIAHCLEMDVCGHGKSKGAAFKMMLEAVGVQVATSLAHGNRANIFQPADAKFFEMFSAGKDVAQGECLIQHRCRLNDNVTVETDEAREYTGAYAMA